MSQPTVPQPPYDGVPLPRRFRDVPFDQLPMGLQARVRMFAPVPAPASGPAAALSVTVGEPRPQSA